MAEKIKIEVFKNKNADELTLSLADPASRAQSGSAAAMTAATAVSLMKRVAAVCLDKDADSERAQWLDRNCETLRKYMVQLVDEDVKCRGPLAKAMKEGGPREIEAARHPACAICEEIVNMMQQSLGLMAELKSLCPVECVHFVREAAYFAYAAIKASQEFILDMVTYCSDETYVFVTRRENEIVSAQCEEAFKAVIEG